MKPHLTYDFYKHLTYDFEFLNIFDVEKQQALQISTTLP